MKEEVIKYYQCLLGQCGYLLTDEGIYQYVCYAETKDELILDAYEGLSEIFWSKLHHIPKTQVIGHFTHYESLLEYFKGNTSIETREHFEKFLKNRVILQTRYFKKKDDIVEWVYHCPPAIGESYTITRVNKKKYKLEVTQNNG